MKVRKIPLRTCLVSREKLPKGEMIRIVRTPENEIKVDLTGKMNGHGVYIKKELLVLEKAIKTKIIEKNLEVLVPDSIYEELRGIINE